LLFLLYLNIKLTMVNTLKYHDFSIKGDKRWSDASRVTGYAPFLVFNILLLSMIQAAIGAAWLSAIKNLNVYIHLLSHLFALLTCHSGVVVQTLLLPGIAFFNAPTSLHLHLLTRRNPPGLALTFSGIIAICFLLNSLLWLVSCTSNVVATQSFINVECPKGLRGVTDGPSKPVWDLMIAFGLLSAVFYAGHAGMALYVMRDMRRKGPEVVEHIELNSAEAQTARDRWARIQREGYLS